jgi:hypothetical protein
MRHVVNLPDGSEVGGQVSEPALARLKQMRHEDGALVISDADRRRLDALIGMARSDPMEHYPAAVEGEPGRARTA